MSKKSIRVEIDDELHTKVKIKCAATGKTIADIIRDALRRWVDQEHPIVIPPKKR